MLFVSSNRTPVLLECSCTRSYVTVQYSAVQYNTVQYSTAGGALKCNKLTPHSPIQKTTCSISCIAVSCLNTNLFRSISLTTVWRSIPRMGVYPNSLIQRHMHTPLLSLCFALLFAVLFVVPEFNLLSTLPLIYENGLKKFRTACSIGMSTCRPSPRAGRAFPPQSPVHHLSRISYLHFE